MTARRLIQTSILAMISFGATRSTLAERITFEVSPGSKACTIVNIPYRWKVPDPESREFWGPFTLSWEDDFEFRRPEGSEDEIFITVARKRNAGTRETRLLYPPSDVSAVQVYRVKGGHGYRVRVATKKEWDEAEPILMFRFPTGNGLAGAVPDTFALSYKGHTFERTGEHWLGSMGGGTDYASRLSADDRFVAVNSWSGVALPGAPLGEWGGSNYHGEWFVDIYILETFKKVIAIRGQFGGLGPQDFVERSFWLGKRYFVLPLKTDMTRLMFCDVTALEQ